MKFVNIVFICCADVFFGSYSSDLLGKSLAGKFEDWGLLGIANIIILLLSMYLMLKRSKDF